MAQLKTNNQSTLCSPRSFTGRIGSICLSHPKVFSASQRLQKADGVAGMPAYSAAEVRAALLIALRDIRCDVQPVRGVHEILGESIALAALSVIRRLRSFRLRSFRLHSSMFSATSRSA